METGSAHQQHNTQHCGGLQPPSSLTACVRCCCGSVEFDINHINRNINAKSKEIGQKKKVIKTALAHKHEHCRCTQIRSSCQPPCSLAIV